MQITIQDKSNYLKGLLITAKKDNQLTDTEKKIIRGIAERLGFASDFYEDSLKSLLANKYLLDDPIIFSDIKIAESFIADGLKLVFADNMFSDVEINWLKMTARANTIHDEWFEDKLKRVKESSHINLNANDFALYSII
jgi:hypothetical protein